MTAVSRLRVDRYRVLAPRPNHPTADKALRHKTTAEFNAMFWGEEPPPAASHPGVLDLPGSPQPRKQLLPADKTTSLSRRASALLRLRPADSVLRLCAAVLGPQADRYRDDWRNELHELCAEGAGWRGRTAYVLAVAGTVPALVVQWRLKPQRATE